MKKKNPIGIVVGVVVAVAVISSVGKRSHDTDTPTSTPETAVQADVQDAVSVDSVSDDSASYNSDDNSSDPDEEPNIKILSHEVRKGSDDKDYLVIEYEWTNDRDNAVSFSVAITDKVYQNGIECESNSLYLDDDDVDVQKQLNDVQPGYTYTLKVAYALQDNTDVQVKCTKTFSDIALVDEVIELGGGAGVAVDVDPQKETSLTITNHYLTKDYKDNDVLIVEYDFYNGEDEAKSYSWFFNVQAFQNGVECDDTVLGVDEINTQTQLNDIQPGVTVHIIEGYHLSDLTSDVNIVATKSISLNSDEYLNETIKLS